MVVLWSCNDLFGLGINRPIPRSPGPNDDGIWKPGQGSAKLLRPLDYCVCYYGGRNLNAFFFLVALSLTVELLDIHAAYCMGSAIRFGMLVRGDALSLRIRSPVQGVSMKRTRVLRSGGACVFVRNGAGTFITLQA